MSTKFSFWETHMHSYEDEEWVQVFQKASSELPFEPKFWPRIRLIAYSLADKKLTLFTSRRHCNFTAIDPETAILICRIIQSVNGGHRFQVLGQGKASRTIFLGREDLAEREREEFLKSQETNDGNVDETIL